MESKGQVVKAMVVIRRPRDDALLVSEAANPAGELFHRPLGGHVKFGEFGEILCTASFRKRSGTP